MNNVREIERINERELDLAVEGAASWHDDYKDSAYIFVGNLDKRLTEGDVITIFSQYGEILDINLPRIPEGGIRNQVGMDAEGEKRLTNEQKQVQQNGKPGEKRGFGFLLFEDQRSTILAIDNLNGFQLLGRTLRVDHVKDYKMPKRRNEEGEVEEPAGPSRNAAPPQQTELRPSTNGNDRGDSMDEEEDIDLEDPMAKYIARSKSSNSKDEDKEERKRRKEERRRIREEREQRRKAREYSYERRDERKEYGQHRHRTERDEGRKHHRREDERRDEQYREASSKRSSRGEREVSRSYSKEAGQSDRSRSRGNP